MKSRHHTSRSPARRERLAAASEPSGWLSLSTCSLCLRTLRSGEWIEAETIIRELRSFEHQSPPRLRSAVCDACVESIYLRRAQPEALAA